MNHSIANVVDPGLARKMGNDGGTVFLNSLGAGCEKRRDHSVSVRIGSDSQRNPGHGVRRLEIL